MEKFVPTQTFHCSETDYNKICSLDVDVIEEPTTPLIHPMARFWYILSGRGTLKLQDREYPLTPGTLVSILPWQISDIVQVEEPIHIYFLAYSFDNMNSILKTFCTVDNRSFRLMEELGRLPVVDCSEAQARQAKQLFEQIREEAGLDSLPAHRGETDQLHYPFLISKMIELITLYYRAGQASPGVPASIQKSDVLHYMYNHLSEKLTLSRLSKLFFMSESTISAYIQQTTGLSFFDLLNEMRIGKTLNYLIYTDLTIQELAGILGFVDSAHISKVFSAKMGMTAQEYRRTYQNVGILCNIREDRNAYELIDYIYRNCTEPLTPQSVAARFQISQKELHQILLYQVEKDFTDFLNYLRINRACVLLKTTERTIMDIAFEMGYNNLKTFSRNFMRFRGMSAREFRRNITLQSPEL